jgi:hypothetical protein
VFETSGVEKHVAALLEIAGFRNWRQVTSTLSPAKPRKTAKLMRQNEIPLSGHTALADPGL